ncbi:uncharacterized protein LOC119989319 isoform X2 [Tripterygium wilfordii]|uniref:uncharacterized protein LOC119989319 isoform X2 n=1 Tax=Tripterygium wilfordii TaxID=458696 RepID=UPI0018F7ED69|nr:uncharacterized protein LOC119989319 isoform X2 [Tripterygium wilfordii]
MASATSFLSYFAKHYPLLTSSTSPNPFLAAQGSIASSSYSLSAESSKHHVQLKYFPPRASAEGAPSELIEDSKFVPLNDDDPVYGPPIQMLLKELDGEFLEVIFCTEEMINRSLWEAMQTKQTNLEAVKIAKSLPRICFLSGLSGEETMMFMDAFPETGLEPAVFAALVPNSANKPVQELIEEIMGDHEMLTGKQPGFK